MGRDPDARRDWGQEEKGTTEDEMAGCPSTSAGDLRELPMVPLRGEGCCGVGRASRDSAGFGAMEEGLISRGGRRLDSLEAAQGLQETRVATREESGVLVELTVSV